ncbi:homocysteine S-methyltransferase [Chitinivorax sp. B]|uniref:homocysteine S-methyltransferase n=1 Tax=Chitinivorax sp. B TaxID=2502235 RepID=UPI0010F5D51F|nr:homocysteine S-methyltransferase [Chitinivorax sp. B]
MNTLDTLQAITNQQRVIILDGALATELERRGAKLNDSLWSARLLMEQPAMIAQVHLDYFMAGANVATTASYQATFARLAERGIGHAEARVLMMKSVELAQSARDTFMQQRPDAIRPLIAASIGPYGAFLANGAEYRGEYGLDDAQLRDFHHERIAVLLAAGADLLAFETIPSQQEARVLARLLYDEFPQAKAWISFSCKDEMHICEGDRFDACVAELANVPQLLAIGVNCTSPVFVSSLLRLARQVTDKPLLAYPNSGEQYDPLSKTWQGAAELASFAQAAQSWHTAGANWIGGCCRTTPADIQAIYDWARH